MSSGTVPTGDPPRAAVGASMVFSEWAIHSLEVLLPMAKGYAHEHDVGDNKRMVQEIENELRERKALEE